MNNSTDISWRWENEYRAVFSVGDDKIVVGFSYIDEPSELGLPDEVDVVEVMFWRNGSTDVTGEGDAIRIFSTVADITRSFQQKNKVDALLFSANEDERSRLKFYNRLAKKLDPQAELIQNGDEVIFIATLNK